VREGVSTGLLPQLVGGDLDELRPRNPEVVFHLSRVSIRLVVERDVQRLDHTSLHVSNLLSLGVRWHSHAPDRRREKPTGAETPADGAPWK
jgi:hypothetical protein